MSRIMRYPLGKVVVDDPSSAPAAEYSDAVISVALVAQFCRAIPVNWEAAAGRTGEKVACEYICAEKMGNAFTSSGWLLAPYGRPRK